MLNLLFINVNVRFLDSREHRGNRVPKPKRLAKRARTAHGSLTLGLTTGAFCANAAAANFTVSLVRFAFDVRYDVNDRADFCRRVKTRRGLSFRSF
jgi:hypothetical protein